jgi:hypothetical protein
LLTRNYQWSHHSTKKTQQHHHQQGDDVDAFANLVGYLISLYRCDDRRQVALYYYILPALFYTLGIDSLFYMPDLDQSLAVYLSLAASLPLFAEDSPPLSQTNRNQANDVDIDQ